MDTDDLTPIAYGSIIISNEITDFLKRFQVGRLYRLPRFDRLTSILNTVTDLKGLM